MRSSGLLDSKPAAVILIVAVFLTGILIWRIIRSGTTWQAWVCYQVAVLHSLLLTRCRATNPCPFPESGAAIIVANHTSPVDPVVLWLRHYAGFRRKRIRVVGYMMAKEYYQRKDIVGWVCRAMQCIPIDRKAHDAVAVHEALRRLHEGHLLGLFPEGRLNVESPESKLIQAGTGVAWLALKARVPVFPVFIHNAPRSGSMVGAFFVRTQTRLTYGQPIDLSRWFDIRVTHEVLTEVTDLIMGSIAELGGVQFTRTSLQRTSDEKSGDQPDSGSLQFRPNRGISTDREGNESGQTKSPDPPA